MCVVRAQEHSHVRNELRRWAWVRRIRGRHNESSEGRHRDEDSARVATVCFTRMVGTCSSKESF